MKAAAGSGNSRGDKRKEIPYQLPAHDSAGNKPKARGPRSVTHSDSVTRSVTVSDGSLECGFTEGPLPRGCAEARAAMVGEVEAAPAGHAGRRPVRAGERPVGCPGPSGGLAETRNAMVCEAGRVSPLPEVAAQKVGPLSVRASAREQEVVQLSARASAPEQEVVHLSTLAAALVRMVVQVSAPARALERTAVQISVRVPALARGVGQASAPASALVRVVVRISAPAPALVQMVVQDSARTRGVARTVVQVFAPASALARRVGQLSI